MSDLGLQDFFEVFGKELTNAIAEHCDWRRKTLNSMDRFSQIPRSVREEFVEKYSGEIGDYAVWKLQHNPNMAGNFNSCLSWFNEVVNRDPRERGGYDYLLKVYASITLLHQLTDLSLKQLRSKIIRMIDNGEMLWRN